MFKIVCKEKLNEQVFLIKFDAPLTAAKAKAGQFIIFRIDEFGERVPLTIADSDKENGTITIIFQVVGSSTKMLSELNEGDSILDLVGPLGRPTEIKKYGTVVCVAGGYGAAPCYLIAKAFKEVGNKVYMIMGARSKDLIFWQDKMEEACSKLFITTDDGSLGVKGFVTEVLQGIIDSEKVDYTIAVGPLPMMRAVAELTKSKEIYTEASMNPIMVDGTGMCGACRVTVGDEVKFACVDGPDFNAHLIDFDEVINRSKIYKEEEKKRSENCNLLKMAKI